MRKRHAFFQGPNEIIYITRTCHFFLLTEPPRELSVEEACRLVVRELTDELPHDTYALAVAAERIILLRPPDNTLRRDHVERVLAAAATRQLSFN